MAWSYSYEELVQQIVIDLQDSELINIKDFISDEDALNDVKDIILNILKEYIIIQGEVLEWDSQKKK